MFTERLKTRIEHQVDTRSVDLEVLHARSEGSAHRAGNQPATPIWLTGSKRTSEGAPDPLLLLTRLMSGRGAWSRDRRRRFR
jgi:hypothetical protein